MVGERWGIPFLLKIRAEVVRGQGGTEKISGTLELIFFRSEGGGKPGTFCIVHNRDLSTLSYKKAHKSQLNLAIENNLICRIDLKSNYKYHVIRAT